MLIDRDIRKYIVFSEDSLINALKKISDNKSRVIFSVDQKGILEGILTDGDFRRWLVQQENIDLNQSVQTASNKKFKYCFINDSPESIQAHFSSQIQFIPLIDESHHLVAIAKQNFTGIQIGDFTLDENSPALIIAEIGINHNGNLKLAKDLVDAAANAGADCAKFQMRSMASLYRNTKDGNAGEDLGTQYTLDLLSRFQLSNEKMLEIFDYCRQRNLLPLCTPWDLESLQILEEYGMQAYKLASADLTNHDLLLALAQTRKPLLCSTGMSTESEISEAVNLLKKQGAIYVLLHCNSTYPAPFKDVNLNYLDRLREIGGGLVGYSGHERGFHVAIAAVAKGAKVIEKHFTLDKSMEGNDHKVSLLPYEFESMVKAIREVEESLGTSESRRLTQGELMNRVTLAKSLVINCDLQPGQIITEKMIEVKSPGRGLQPNYKDKLVGRKSRRKFQAGDFFFPSDLEDEVIQARSYHFNRPWGVPVRYHDFKAILKKSNPDFLEFHLSYKDMELDIETYFDTVYDLDLVVHSPDLFSGDFLLNLAAENEKDRQRSVKELQRVVNITRQLNPFFKRSTHPFIVASLGGFTKDKHITIKERQKLYDLVAQSLSEIDFEGIEILPQTLPPFPWYFGGQLYLNLFVDPEDTTDFCKKYGYRLCLDISHSKLACNYYRWSFQSFLEKVLPLTAHLHIVDAAGVDGEGLQIGDGDIDFRLLMKTLNQKASGVSFIPEIWQGHKNEGEGFWIALDRLEKFTAD